VVFAVTILVFYLMTAPDTSPGVSEASNLLGGTEITDSIGHVILFALLSAAWYIGFRYRWSPKRAFYQTVAVAILIGTATELFQGIVPHRGMALGDLLANWSGVLLFAVLCKAKITGSP
jgi:VanZ family protein